MSNCVHMKLKWPLLVLTFICAFFSVPAVGQNVEIMRSDFEDGTGKWEARGTGSVSIRSTKDEALRVKRVCVSGVEESSGRAHS